MRQALTRLAMFVLAMTAAAAHAEPGVTATTILIGESAAFSGPAQALGNEMRAGATAYFQAINAAGGINGRRIELRSLDDGFVPEIFDPSAIDGRFLVTTAESIDALRRLTVTEGIFAGVSAGGVLVVASRLAQQMDGGTVVALLADAGWKYLSEEIWSRDLEDESVEALNLW